MDPKTPEIGFIGLGVMGSSLSGHLISAGYDLRVTARSREKAKGILERGARWVEFPAELASQCDVVFTMVGSPCDVESLYFGAEGLLSGLRPGTLLVDMTTSSPKLAVRISKEAKTRGGGALDAPVSGGDRGAREATLSIMVGGEPSEFERARPLLRLMGKTLVYQGPAGSGQHCKMCNQIAIAGGMMGVCEAMTYARHSGLNPDAVLQSLSTGAAASWTLSNLAPRMLAGDFKPGFAVKHFIKDLKIALESAEEMGLRTPGTELALRLYLQLAQNGSEEEGTQALLKIYSRIAEQGRVDVEKV